jgi:hypothetical protein
MGIPGLPLLSLNTVIIPPPPPPEPLILPPLHYTVAMGSPVVFRDLGCTGEDIGRVRASALQTILRVLGGSGGDLFGYVAGLMSTIGCLEGHNVKPVEVAAMREVCRVRGWEVPSEFSLNPPNSPAVLIHWRALIELLGLMPAPRREALCSLRFPVVSSWGSGSSGEPPAVKPEEPMDWSHEGRASGGSVGRVPAEGQRGPSQSRRRGLVGFLYLGQCLSSA